jgi:hypothetical protein
MKGMTALISMSCEMCVSIVIAYPIDESTGYPAYKQKFIQGSFVSEAKDSLENDTKVSTIVALVNKRHPNC